MTPSSRERPDDAPNSRAEERAASLRPRIAILGAGPIGLEAALAAAEAGLPFTVYEAAPTVGANVREWGHVRLFTSWTQTVSPRERRHLEEAGVRVSRDDGACPTGRELVEDVLEPVAALPSVSPNLETGVRVVSVGRERLLKHEAIGAPERADRPFRLLLEGDGRRWVEPAEVVLDCTGSWGHPLPVGNAGIPAPGEERLGERLVRRIPDLAAESEEWAGKTVLLVGAGHSAQTAVRDLARLAEENPGTRVIWALRRAEPTWSIDPEDPLPARAGLTRKAQELARAASSAVETRLGVVVEAFEPRENGPIEVTLATGDGTEETVPVDRVLALTGSVGDATLYRQLQIHECYATSGPMKLAAALLADGSTDCLDQTSHGVEALKSPEPDFYILGSKSYGRNTTFLLRVGWEQVDEVFAELPRGTMLPGCGRGSGRGRRHG